MVSPSPRTSATAPARILIVDDHPLVREGLAALLQMEAGFVLAGQAGNGAEALVGVERFRPDLILLDLSLPDVDGVDLISSLRSRYPAIPVLVLSMHDEGVYAARTLRAGANGYLMKDAPARTILDSIRSVLHGKTVFNVDVVPPQLATKRRPATRPRAKTGIVSLSNRELQVFDAVGRGQSAQRIADALGLSEKTVETYRKHIKRKLGLRTAAALTHEAFRWVESEAGSRLRQESAE